MCSMFSYAGDKGNLEDINPDTLLSVKARTIQTFVMTIESQQAAIADLQWKLRSSNEKYTKLRSQCTF